MSVVSLFPKASRPGIRKIVDAANEFENPNEVLYNIIGILKGGNVNTLQDLQTKCLQDLKNGSLGWESFVFEAFKGDQYAEDQALEKPQEIREGDADDAPCRKCGVKKIMFVSQQTRSADEGMTTKVYCFNPACKFVETLQ